MRGFGIIVVFSCVLGLVWPAAADGPRMAVTILPLPSRDVSPPVRDRILAYMARQLRAQYNARVLSGRAVGRAVFGTLGSGLEQAAMRFSSKVAEGKRAYQQLQVGKTIELMKEAENWQQYCGSEIREPAMFTELHLYKGLALLAQGDKRKAMAAFRQALAHDPQLKLSPKRFPPDVLAVFRQARKQLLATQPAMMAFRSRPPGATVYIDGKRRGTTPIEGTPVYPGRHFVRLEREGYSVWTLNLPEGPPPPRIQALLVPLWTGGPPRELISNAIAVDRPDEPVMAQLRLLAGFFRADAMVLASISRDGQSHHLGVRVYVVRPEVVTRARLFNLGENTALYEKKVKGVVSTMKTLGQAGPGTMAGAPSLVPPPPGGGGSGRVAVPGSGRPVPKPESNGDDSTAWYESWWFWTAVGVVVAGSATALTLWLVQPEESWTLVVQPRR